MILGTDDTRYAFVNGIIRAKEAKLLKRAHFERLIDADLSSFNVILGDTLYSGEGEFSSLLKKTEEEERRFFDRYCLHIEAKRCFTWPEAIHNLKVKIKDGPDELLYPTKTEEIELWEELSPLINEFLDKRDSFLFSTGLDRILAQKLYENAQFSPFFVKYYQLYFDLENIRAMFRARQYENPKEVFEHVFLNYGTIPKEIFNDIIGEDYSAIIKAFSLTPFEELIEEAINSFKEKISFIKLERLIEETRLKFLKLARYYTFGVEPLFGYHNFKRAEIRYLRQVYVGRLNNIPAPQMKEGIPDVW